MIRRLSRQNVSGKSPVLSQRLQCHFIGVGYPKFHNIHSRGGNAAFLQQIQHRIHIDTSKENARRMVVQHIHGMIELHIIHDLLGQQRVRATGSRTGQGSQHISRGKEESAVHIVFLLTCIALILPINNSRILTEQLRNAENLFIPFPTGTALAIAQPLHSAHGGTCTDILTCNASGIVLKGQRDLCCAVEERGLQRTDRARRTEVHSQANIVILCNHMINRNCRDIGHKNKANLQLTTGLHIGFCQNCITERGTPSAYRPSLICSGGAVNTVNFSLISPTEPHLITDKGKRSSILANQWHHRLSLGMPCSIIALPECLGLSGHGHKGPQHQIWHLAQLHMAAAIALFHFQAAGRGLERHTHSNIPQLLAAIQERIEGHAIQCAVIQNLHHPLLQRRYRHICGQ